MVFPPCLLHALLPRGKQGTSHEPFRQLFSGLKIPEVFTEAICTQFREGEHKRDWALWVLVGLGLQSAALSCEPKRRQGQSVLGCPGGSSRFSPLSFAHECQWIQVEERPVCWVYGPSTGAGGCAYPGRGQGRGYFQVCFHMQLCDCLHARVYSERASLLIYHGPQRFAEHAPR